MILVIDKSLKNARTIQDLFYYMGIPAAAVNPENAVREISNRYRAVLISNPESIGTLNEFIKTLNTYSLGAPIFALCENPEKFKYENPSYALLFDGIFNSDIKSSEVFYRITDFQTEHKLPQIGDYKLSGIDASVFRNDVYFFDTPIHFTKTETMILRFLIRSYPSASFAKDLLKYAFKTSKIPEIQSIRTHISVMNKKFKTITGRNLIYSEPRAGYTLFTPELAQNIF